MPKSCMKKEQNGDFNVLDAPVTGGDTGAREGTLSILVGGDKSDYTNCHELFEAMGTNINYEVRQDADSIANLQTRS